MWLLGAAGWAREWEHVARRDEARVDQLERPLPGQRSRTPSAHACFVSAPFLRQEGGVCSVFGVMRE